MFDDDIAKLTALLTTIQLECGGLLSERDAQFVAIEAFAHARAAILNAEEQL